MAAADSFDDDGAGFDDEIMETRRVLGELQRKLAFATHILDAAVMAPKFREQIYEPLSLPHRPPAVMIRDYGVQSYQLRLFLFATAASNRSVLFEPSNADLIIRNAQQQSSPTWLLAASEPPPATSSYPPTFVTRTILSILGAVNVWTHSPALCSTTNLCLNDTWQDLTNFLDQSTHFLAVTTDSPDYRPPHTKHLWLLHPTSMHAPLPRDVKLFAFADFQNTWWGVYGSSTAAALLSDLQLLRLHSFFKCHRSGWSNMWSPAPASPQLLRLYTQGIKAALLSSNPG